MVEYIEREKLRKTLKEEMQILKETPGKDDWDKGIIQGIKESIMHLNVAPAADVVEVVRCKNCKYSRPKDDIEKMEYYESVIICESFEMNDCATAVYPDDFCSYGERKED